MKVWHHIKDDGASWICKDCDAPFPASEVIATESTNHPKSKTVLCKECVEPDWMEGAVQGEPV